MSGDDDDERTQFMSQPVPARPAPPQDDDDERTQFISVPGAAAALAGGAAASDDDDRTQFISNPAPVPPAADGTQPPAATHIPGEAPPAEYNTATFDENTEQPTSTGAFPQVDPTQAAPVPPSSQPPARGAPAPIGVGTIINNNYRIEQVLKSGGMGSVFRGVNIHTEDPVAIKVILPELAEDEKVGLMFKREARTLGQLQDDAIVRYYNYVYDPALDGYCLVMGFISGVPLSDHTGSHGPITVDAGKVLLRRLAKGLQKAHDQDVVHRDLSPDNVMLPDGIVAEAVLIDFGIAKSNVVKEGTMAGQFAGKFKYVAPEQLGHFGGEIGPRADIYSLALLMAAATVGKPLDMGSSIVEAVNSRASIPDLSEVPQDLRPIMAHMLEPDPENRPESMSQIVELMDHPERIPQNYRDGLPLPNTALPSSGTTTRTFAPISQTVQGLQAPPSAMNVGGTMQGGDLPPVVTSKSGTLFPLIMIALLAAAGAGAYFTMGDEIMAMMQGAPDEPDEPDTPPGLPERASNSREGFLAEFESGECTYATRVASGEDAGMLAGFAQAPGAFDDLPAAYEEKWGSRPAITDRIVTNLQCPALDFTRALQGTVVEPITLELDTKALESGGSFSGRITDKDERRIWLALVSSSGSVFNLTPRLSDSVGGVRTFQFGVNLPRGENNAPQLILAVASDDPLIRTAASRDGAAASGLLPLILREIETNSGQATAALGHVLLFKPEAPENEAPDDRPQTTAGD